jgi:hypothetical protein
MIRQGIVFLAGIGSTLALDVLKDIIKDRIKALLASRSGPESEEKAPNIEIRVIQTGDAPLVVVERS